MPTKSFSQRLLNWFDRYGRTDLPWQQHPTPYRVWISEIMLQQTQVNTVIPYYQRFIQRFTDIPTLAAATNDDVLHYWTGLGYYARARNLHRAAQLIVSEYAAELPTDLATLMGLPGIGRSTAGAILALAHRQRQPILDGNVKRVLCRYHALEGSPTETKVANQLWGLADQHTPNRRVAAYTQAIMDLGATICTRSRPKCALCPFTQDCAARLQGQPEAYPTPKPRKTKPVKSLTFIMLQNPLGEVLLQKRPTTGVWGGLWSFPECPTTADISAWCQQHLNQAVPKWETWQSLRHTFTHFHLDITPVHISPIEKTQTTALKQSIWYNNSMSLGLAAPVVRLLEQLR